MGGKGYVDKMVKYLLDDYCGAGHFVYTDNVYNSFDQTEYLLDKNTYYVTRTIRLNRKGNPSDIINTNLKKESIDVCIYNRKGICVILS